MASFAPFSSATLAGSQLKQSCRPLSAGKQPSAANSGAAHCRRKASYLASHNRNAEIQLGWPSAESFFPDDNAPESTGRIDVLGLGQAMIDFGAAVGDEWLTELQVEKGARKLITAEDRGEILQKLESTNYQITAGGSLSNTLMALARLGAAGQPGADGIHVAMAGLVGSDPLGSFYSAQMQGAGVSVVSDPVEGASTGTVVVLTSPDAQRTMLSYLGTPAEIKIDARLEEAISRSTLLVIEGYLWELPRAAETISAAIAVAQRHGAMVAMTAGDAGVVERHHSEMWAAIDAGIDLLFTNADEATALVQHSPEGSAAVQASAPGQSPAEAAALALGPHCSLVCVTDGSAGSVLTALGEVYVVPPHWTSTPPVDTCGAGDAYAAGLLYGFLRRYDVVTMGRTAARTASAVIAHHGSTLNEEDAAAVVGGLPSAARSMTAPAPATAEVEAKGVA